MSYKVAFLSNVWRTVDCDHHATDDRLLVFTKDGQPVFTAVLSSVAYWHPANEINAVPVPLMAQCGEYRPKV